MYETALVAAFFPLVLWIALLSYGFLRDRKKRLSQQEPGLLDHTQQVLLLLSLLAVISITVCIGYLFVLPF